MKKVGSFFKALLPLVIMFVEQIAVAGILSGVKVAQFTMTHLNDADAIMEYSLALATDKNYLMTITMVFEVVAFITFALIYFLGTKAKVNTFKGHMTIKSVGIIALLFLGVEAIIGCVLNLIYLVAPSAMEAYSELIEQSGLGDMTVLSTILTLVCAPIVEEIAFRGLTVKWASGFTKKFWVLNIFQAVCFGIAHGNLVQGTYAFVLGLVLGYVANKYKSLWASILGHLVFNFTGTYLVAVFFGTAENVPGWRLALVAVCSLVAIAVSAFFLLKDKTYVEEAPVAETCVAEAAPTDNVL